MRCRIAFLLSGVLLLPGCTSQDDAPSTAGSPSPQPATPAPDDPPEQPDEPFILEEGFTLLNLEEFQPFQAEPDTWLQSGNTLRCSGQPRGYLYSKDEYQNFTLRFDYRFPDVKNSSDATAAPQNTGFLIYVTGEHKIWPVCLEVQGKYAEMATIKENGGAERPTIHDDQAAREEARKPLGSWNSIDIVSRDGALAASINGVEVCRSEPNFLGSGAIGIQSEGYSFELRNLRIRDE